MYVLQDTNFRFLTHLSDGSQYLPAAESVSWYKARFSMFLVQTIGWIALYLHVVTRPVTQFTPGCNMQRNPAEIKVKYICASCIVH